MCRPVVFKSAVLKLKPGINPMKPKLVCMLKAFGWAKPKSPTHNTNINKTITAVKALIKITNPSSKSAVHKPMTLPNGYHNKPLKHSASPPKLNGNTVPALEKSPPTLGETIQVPLANTPTSLISPSAPTPRLQAAKPAMITMRLPHRWPNFKPMTLDSTT